MALRSLLLLTLAMPAMALAQPASAPSPVRAIGTAAPYSSVVTSPRRAVAIKSSRDLILDHMEKIGIPGASVAVAVGGVPVWAEGFGLADVEQGVPVTPATRFRSGSVAKPITAVVGAVLHDRGLLDYDAPIQKYLPSFPQQSRRITYRMLTGHLAGFRHYAPDGDEFFNHRRFETIDEAFDPSRYSPLLFEPGDGFLYSSYGTHLEGMVIQAAGGRDFLSLVQELVFEPLGMLSSQGDRNEQIIPQRTRYYERAGGKPHYRLSKMSWGDGERGELRNAPYADNSNKFPAGGYITTPTDIVRFGSALLQPGFLKADTLRQLFTSQRTRDGKETAYGMNWRIKTDARGRTIYYHGGESVGGSSMVAIFPREKLVVALQANLTNSTIEKLPEQIGALFLER